MDSPISRAEHLEFVRRCEDEHKRINKRLDKVEHDNQLLHKLATDVGKMAVSMENMMKEQIKQGEKLETLEELPNKGWNTLKNGIFNAIGAAIGGGIIAALVYFISMKG